MDGNTFRRGILNGVEVDGFNLRFYIDDEQIKEKFYTVPYPFDVKQSCGVLYFDYRLNSVKTIKKTRPVLDRLIAEQKRRSKLLDNILTITVMDV